MSKLTIHDIKARVKATGSHYFDRDTLKHFGQTLKAFAVHNVGGGAFISAPIIDNDNIKRGESRRYFNAKTNELEIVNS